MFGVVDFHGPRIDMGFECVVGVGQLWKRVGHGGLRGMYERDGDT